MNVRVICQLQANLVSLCTVHTMVPLVQGNLSSVSGYLDELFMWFRREPGIFTQIGYDFQRESKVNGRH
jgi:hypothetical protein